MSDAQKREIEKEGAEKETLVCLMKEKLREREKNCTANWKVQCVLDEKRR